MGRPHLRPGAHGRKSCSYLVCFLRVGVGSASPEHCQAGSHTSRLWAAVLPASAGYSTLIPSTRAAGTWIQRRSPGTLNEAVNEEVSSLKPSGRRPPNVLTSGPPFSQTPPLLQGPSNWFPAASSAPCWQCCCSRGARTASPGCGTRHHQPPAPSACLWARSLFSSLGQGRALLLGPEKVAPPVLTTDARVPEMRGGLAVRNGGALLATGPSVRQMGWPQTLPSLLLTGRFRAQASTPCPQETVTC